MSDADRYIRRIRNTAKDDPANLSYMAAQAVRIDLDQLQAMLQPTVDDYAPDACGPVDSFGTDNFGSNGSNY